MDSVERYVEKTYKCNECKYVNECNDGENCYIDYKAQLKYYGKREIKNSSKYGYYIKDYLQNGGLQKT